jgi:GNAT superfamily N-acetyltransferase
VRECFRSGFGHTEWPIWEFSEQRVIDEMIDLDVRLGSISLVAEIGGAARGVLIGSTRTGRWAELRMIALSLPFVFRRWVTDRDSMLPFARANLLKLFAGELSYQRHSPAGGAGGILDLTSVEGYRGGVGTALMDAFVAEARRCGLKRIDVETDSELSWNFYERYGFRRVREFPVHIYDYSLPGRDVTGYIYSLDI